MQQAMWNWVCGVGGVDPVHRCLFECDNKLSVIAERCEQRRGHNEADVTIDAGQTYVQDDDIGIEVARGGDRADAVAGHDRLELLAF